MAGHSHAANVAHRKNAQNNKKAKIFTKLLREIYVSSKESGVIEEFNPRLRMALARGRLLNLPKDKIDGVFKRVSGGEDEQSFDEVRYDGYAKGGIGLIVEALTDNRNRTASDVRSVFTKFAGNLGESGSLNFLFQRLGVIYYTKASINQFDRLFEECINASAQECEDLGDVYEITTSLDSFAKVKEHLEGFFGQSEEVALQYRRLDVSTRPDIEVNQNLKDLVDALEDLDDVQNVWY